MTEADHTQRPAIHCVLWHAQDAPPSFELIALLSQRGLTLETCDNPYAAAARVCRFERTLRARRGSSDASTHDASTHHTVALAGATPAQSPEPQDRPILVLLAADPSRLPLRDGVARVLELHAPRTICWIYESDQAKRLRVVPLAALSALPETRAPEPTVLPAPAARPAPAPAPKSPAPQTSHPKPQSPAAATAPSRPADPSPRPHLRPDPPLIESPRTEPAKPAWPGLLAAPSRPAPTKPAAPQVPINTANILTDEELAMLLADDDPAPRRPRTTS